MSVPPWVRARDRLRGFAWQLRSALRLGRFEREMDEEHGFHIEREVERLRAEGVDEREARRLALATFGGVERHQEAVREARWTWGGEQVVRDVRHAARGLARRPLFALVATGTMAVGIGAATALFSVVDSVLLRPLDAPDAERLVTVQTTGTTGRAHGAVSLPDFLDYRQQVAPTIDLAAHHLSDVTLSGEGAAQLGLGLDVSGSYFRVLGVTPAAGRFFDPLTADGERAPAEVVLGHDVWRTRFAGDEAVLGRTVRVNGVPLTVVGVAPRGFHGTMLGVRPMVWTPIGLYERLQRRDVSGRVGTTWLQLFGRPAPGVTAEEAGAALAVVAGRLAASYDYPDELEPAGARVAPFSVLPPGQRDAATRFTLILLAASGVLLLIAAVNVAGMLLARASRRGDEMAVRLTLGAGVGRLARQLVVEGLVLGVGGCALGVGVAWIATRVLSRVAPPTAPGFGLDLRVDGAVLAFAAAASLACSLIFGLIPARYVTRRDLSGAIRRAAGTGSFGLGRRLLLSGQVALTMVLLIATSLLLRTMRNALDTDHGFDPEGIVLGEINLRLNGYTEPDGLRFYESLIEQAEASPEVASVALATSIPLGSGWDQTRASVPGLESPEPSGWPVGFSAVSDRYFETLGLPLRAGEPPEAASLPPRIVVNETMADLFWGSAPAVGRSLRVYGRDAEVSGVAPAGTYRALGEEATLFAWVPFSLAYSPSAYVLVRPRTSPGDAARALRRAVADLDPDVPLVNVVDLEAAMGQGLFFQRTAAGLIGTFAAIGLILSAVGIFGLFAYTVEQRRREISVRMAVGASGRRVVRAVLAWALRPVLVGLGVGLVGSLAVTRTLEGLLYDVGPRDPASFAVAALVMLSAALVAAYWPARLAVGVAPAEILRTD